MSEWDFTGLSDDEGMAVRQAIEVGDDLQWRFGERSLGFIVRNYMKLAEMGRLEAYWLSTYLHNSHFEHIGFGKLKAVFDACDRTKLQELSVPVRNGISTERISLFRGCAGPAHTRGMSWTTSLDKAIYYAEWHRIWHLEHEQSGEVAVYATTVFLSEVYCRLDHNEDEFLVVPENMWRIEVPASEFRLDRRRH
ncbi:hypothetical protein ELI25_29720 (plasmid) [Rhizobium ruizarguesonis]|uniref:hypothetical protein n=1 Tax=Rhizobium ruizarguesonis TaxID=2081791 RepID=UPI0010315ED1|nr:hypothetical protein [Rhizobium ruizarguesonis]TAW06642.1 hypothetical protein ELI25_29720 [Rhizobium ruizarguesonis]